MQRPNSFSLAGHAALVTGSSRNIGLAIARELESAGARVVYHGMETAPPEGPAGADYLSLDLLAQGAPHHLIEQAFARQPDLDLLVCNAGGYFDVPFLEMDEARWDRTMRLNVQAAYFVAQAFARELVARGRAGAIVLTCSTNGFQPEDDC